VQATLLFTDSSTNNGSGIPGYLGTQIGLYNVNNAWQTQVLFASGTLFNPGAPNGVIDNNLNPQAPVTVSTWANYGIYAASCWLNASGATTCGMFYSDSPWNWTDPNHQHFSLRRIRRTIPPTTSALKTALIPAPKDTATLTTSSSSSKPPTTRPSTA
jgi:hypothetical protein